MGNNQIHRASWHDYRSPCIYMLTLTKRRGVAAFSSIVGDYRIPVGTAGCPTTALSHLGRIIQVGIKSLSIIEPAIKLLQYSIMPDHVHVLLHVQWHIAEPIGVVVARMKTEINKTYGETGVFDDGFNDQILKTSRSLNTLFQYIRDNPRRLAVRREMPDFFRRVNGLVIGGKQYQAYGNLQLLDNPFKEQVVVHRADDEETRGRMRALWLYTAANGGVLVSPFISPAEKVVRSMAEEVDGRVILIIRESFGERYKPDQHDFGLCSRGRLLIIAPTESLSSREISREDCLAMNALAEGLCGGVWG